MGKATGDYVLETGGRREWKNSGTVMKTQLGCKVKCLSKGRGDCLPLRGQEERMVKHGKKGKGKVHLWY